MSHNLLTLTLRNEHDVVLARQRAGRVASLLGFGLQDQSRIATAVSEIARNAYEYAREGFVYFRLVPRDHTLQIEVKDKGAGIDVLDTILEGSYVSPTGMGVGLLGARRLMDRFDITTSPKGTTVVMEKRLPPRVTINEASIAQVLDGLTRQAPQSLLAELQNHNQEMLQAMADLQAQQQQLLELNQELEDTNRGVVALYAELDERAELLLKSNQIKTRFLSNISHELRTPLNAILSLSNVLMARADGDLSAEQEKQVGFIRRSAESLSEMVNDVLDLAKVDAGKIAIRPETFEIENLFSALRGMMRPLLSDNQKVTLVFEEGNYISPLYTDEGKVSQILRNFISNAIKFTLEGEVRVTASSVEGSHISFSVEDTGIGIADQDLEYIFEEFAQLESSLHKRTKGTGLGLPLARKLAQLLGGDVQVESTVGQGSRFSCTIPIVYQGSGEGDLLGEYTTPSTAMPILPLSDREEKRINSAKQGDRAEILIIDNDPAHCYLLRGKLSPLHHPIREALDGYSGLEIAKAERPALIFLDLVMPHMDGFAVLRELRNNVTTRDIPVIVHTSKALTAGEERELKKLSDSIVSKEGVVSEAGTEKLRQLVVGFLKPKK